MLAKFMRKSAPKSPASHACRQYYRYAVHAVLIAVVVGATEITPTRPASAQTSSTEESVLTLYQLRISAIEQSLKELNARFEEELFELRETVEGSELLRRVESHLNELGNVGGELRTLSNKIDRVLEIAASNEFRIEQLEARLDSLSTTGVPSAGGGATGLPSATSAIGIDSGATGQRPQRNQFADLTEGDAGDSLLGEGEASGVRDLTAGLDNTAGTRSGRQPAQPGSSLLGATSPDSPSTAVGSNTDGVNSLSDLLAAPVSILPEGSEESQYQYALDLALKNRLMDAEEAFAALVELYPQGARNADSMYWLGRIQFLRGAHQEAVISLSAFGRQYPDDPRRVETTMWTAESLAEFAPPDQACAVFARLLDTFSTPPDQLVTRLDALKRRVRCN